MESYAAGETEPPLLEETIGGNFDRTVAAYPDHEALVEFASGRRWTYRELNHDVDLFARGLVAWGLAKGDRIGVWAPSCSLLARRTRATTRSSVVARAKGSISMPSRLSVANCSFWNRWAFSVNSGRISASN